MKILILISILMLMLIATPCFAQQQEARMSLAVVGGGVPAAGGSCNTTTPVISQVIQDGGASDAAGVLSQKIKITSTIRVCQVKIFLVSTYTCHVEFWTSYNMGGSQIGGDSSTQMPIGSWGTVFTWSSNYPELTTDAFMTIVPDGGGSPGDLVVGYLTAGDGDNNYTFLLGTSNQTPKDITFAVYSMQ